MGNREQGHSPRHTGRYCDVLGIKPEGPGGSGDSTPGHDRAWFDIKQRIWERDNFVCQACGLDLEEYPDRLTVGHKIDKVCGGSDQPVNLCLQCVRCNSRKPHHRTLREYEEWVASGGVLPGLLRAPRREGAA